MHRTARPLAVVLTVLAVPGILLSLAACSGNRRQPDTAAAQLSFGTTMAQRGLWQEALFRFNEAERLDPQNFRVHNNLGVAYEAAGNFDQALAHYKRALELAPNNREAKSNYSRFVEFYQNFKAKPGDKKAAAGKGAMPATPGSGKPQLPPGPGSVGRGAPGTGIGSEPPLVPPQPPNAPPRGVPQPPPSGVEPPPPGAPGTSGMPGR